MQLGEGVGCSAPFSSTLGVLPGVAPTPVVVQPVYSLPVSQSLTPFVPAASRCRLMLHPWCNILKAKKKCMKVGAASFLG